MAGLQASHIFHHSPASFSLLFSLDEADPGSHCSAKRAPSWMSHKGKHALVLPKRGCGMQETRGAASRSCCNQGMTQVWRSLFQTAQGFPISVPKPSPKRMVSGEKAFLGGSVALPMDLPTSSISGACSGRELLPLGLGELRKGLFLGSGDF